MADRAPSPRTSSPPTPAPCASTRCRRAARTGRLSRRPASPDARLCTACKRALGADLAALPGLHRESEQDLAPVSGGGLVPRVTGSRSCPPPVSDKALEVRHDVVVRLASWTRLVLDEADGARAPASAPPRRTVADLAAFLGRHVGLLAAHPAAGAAADEIAGAAAALRALAAEPKADLVPLGRCVEPGCDAEVSLPGRGGDDLVLRGPMCEAGHILTPRQWLVLKERTTTTKERA